jgi:hypothetical protein
MKFAAIADVHGNCVAPEAVLADIAGIVFSVCSDRSGRPEARNISLRCRQMRSRSAE